LPANFPWARDGRIRSKVSAARKARWVKKARKLQPAAPALEKRLDLLEALAAEARAKREAISRTGRSFRRRRASHAGGRWYVTRYPLTGDHTLKLQRFRIACQYLPAARLLKAALQAMEQLAIRV